MSLSRHLAALVAGFMMVSPLRADDGLAPAETAIRAAIVKAVPALEKGAAGSAKERKCFTCHNQALPVLALVGARKRGFSIDKEKLDKHLRHSETHLKRGQKGYLEGRGQGGKVITAGYALWALQAGGRRPNELTAAVTHFLLEYQKTKGHWSHPGKRPPSSGSDFTTTYVALRGLAGYGTEKQKARIEERTKAVREWLLGESPKDTEARVFRLRALKYVEPDGDAMTKATARLVDSQRKDGGWSQTAKMKSDAYATATVLVALLRDGGLSADHPAIRRGPRYLVDPHLEDGSWHVVTRAKPFQTYFETGFPHGKDQFISIAASSWATLALVLTIPESP